MRLRCSTVIQSFIRKKEKLLKTPDASDIAFFVEVDLRYHDNVKGKTKNFPFCPENEVIHKNKYDEYSKDVKPKVYTKAKKLIIDCTDKKKYLVQ